MVSSNIANGHAEYDRKTELKTFDETKAGVKGLVDAGVSKVPRIFIHPPENLEEPIDNSHQSRFPVIDLDGFDEDSDRRKEIVNKVRDAAETWGFFQVLGHGIPTNVLEEMINGVRRFHEQDTEVKKQYYTRDYSRRFLYQSNFDLYSAPATNWRDSFGCTMAPNPPEPEELPIACREIMIAYSKQVHQLARLLFRSLSEGLGLEPNHLIEMECAEGNFLIGHYYPACPEPEVTLGTTRHSDNNFMTVLLQDNLGGLQVMHQNRWVDVPPRAGALVVNIGDLMQLISNDKYKSVEHRVLARCVGPRISVATFFGRDSMNPREYGPLEQLVLDQNPAKYRATTIKKYNDYYLAKGLDGTSALLHFRL